MGLASILGQSVGGIVSSVLALVTRFVGDGAAALLTGIGRSLSATTRPVLWASFQSEYAVMTLIGAVLSAPFLVLALVQAVLRQDLGLLGRTVLVRLPVSLLFTGVAVEIVRLSLTATDELCSSVLAVAGAPARSVLDGLGLVVATFGSAGQAGVPFAGFAALLLVALAALLCLVLWLELAVRSAAVAVSALFLPIALSGLVWPATAHWARRLAETIAALVASKLVIVAVLALAASTIASVGSTGLSGVVEGTSMLLLAAAAPFALLRLVPMVEAGAFGQLEGLARRPLHLADPASSTRRTGSDILGLVEASQLLGRGSSAASGLANAGGFAGAGGSSEAAGGAFAGGTQHSGRASGDAGRSGVRQEPGKAFFDGMAPETGDAERARQTSEGLAPYGAGARPDRASSPGDPETAGGPDSSGGPPRSS